MFRTNQMDSLDQKKGLKGAATKHQREFCVARASPENAQESNEENRVLAKNTKRDAKKHSIYERDPCRVLLESLTVVSIRKKSGIPFFEKIHAAESLPTAERRRDQTECLVQYQCVKSISSRHSVERYLTS